MCVRKSDFFPNVSTIMTNGDLCLMCTHRIPQKNLDVGLQPLQNLGSGEFRLPRPWRQTFCGRVSLFVEVCELLPSSAHSREVGSSPCHNLMSSRSRI